ncbi:MAG: hypothetical protein M1817_001288 [Caeruleum heppii]|nr:MAG: hypothetical protein M1817_001288 [Caeruleum heppii]
MAEADAEANVILNHDEGQPAQDVEMAQAKPGEPFEVEVLGTAPRSAETAKDDGDAVNAEDRRSPPRIAFVDYLRSPIVTLCVGSGSGKTSLTAHKALLEHSPWFQDQCASFDPSNPAPIVLEDEQVTTVGSFLEYLYTGEYFPKKLLNSRALEPDPSVPSEDDDGAQLLKHARLYTLADKFGVTELKELAHSKIHRVNSTARGEIAYARYVYGNTSPEDAKIRKPVAVFWAHRSHLLRHEAEREFREMCLEYPQFGFDVLSLVLDARETGKDRELSGDRSSKKEPGSGRKRLRTLA